MDPDRLGVWRLVRWERVRLVVFARGFQHVMILQRSGNRSGFGCVLAFCPWKASWQRLAGEGLWLMRDRCHFKECDASHHAHMCRAP